jgi:uncharacterized caspase-like protein
MMRRGIIFCCVLAVVLLMAVTGICAESVKANKDADGQAGKLTQQANTPRKRVALVIGNSRYTSSSLKLPVNDAHVMASTLRRLGFEVEEKTNLGYRAFKKAVEDFGKRMKGGEVGLFYFAGHGIQVQGKNYLVPVDARVRSENGVSNKAVAADFVLDTMQSAGNAVNIVVLDASRANPLGRSFRPASRGLASMASPSGTIISYAAAPDTTATDGDGSIGTYTDELVQALDTPGLKVEDVFRQVVTQVEHKTSKARVPWQSSSLKGDVYLVPPFNPSGVLRQIAVEDERKDVKADGTARFTYRHGVSAGPGRLLPDGGYL